MGDISLTRLTICGIAVALVVGGVALAFLPGTRVTTSKADVPIVVCSDSVSQRLGPGASASFDCLAQSGDWLALSIAPGILKPGQVSGPVVLQVRSFDVNGSRLVYSSNGTRFSLMMPILTNGTLIETFTNQGTGSSSLAGSIALGRQTTETVALTSTYYPHRVLGVAVAGLSGIVLIVFGWNPRGAGESILSLRKRSADGAKSKQQSV